MIDYKSPIQIIEDQLHNQIITDYENGIMKALMRYQIHVDKEELLKALQYDRGQYEQGYQDGLNADKWIPCSERLPKIGQCVLIQLDMNEYDSEYDSTIQVRRYDGEQDVYKWKWEGLDIWTSEDVVLAWQPLPQPYKKEGAENE